MTIITCKKDDVLILSRGIVHGRGQCTRLYLIYPGESICRQSKDHCEVMKT